MGAFAPLPDMRSCRLLRLLSASARQKAFSQKSASDRPVLRARRGLALVLRPRNVRLTPDGQWLWKVMAKWSVQSASAAAPVSRTNRSPRLPLRPSERHYLRTLLLANTTQYGLTGAVFTRDLARGSRFAEWMQVGTSRLILRVRTGFGDTRVQPSPSTEGLQEYPLW
jgi:hypothetical protein